MAYGLESLLSGFDQFASFSREANLRVHGVCIELNAIGKAFRRYLISFS